jgi:monovalent cation:H+ antiporter, CPA1 family
VLIIEPISILILLTIGYIVYTIDKKKKNLPVPVVLLIIGMVLGFFPSFEGVELTKDTIFHWFLPALLFISAYQYPVHSLKKHGGEISILSTAGILITALFMSVLIYYTLQPVLSISYIEALLISTILTPTDPVSVVSILKRSTNKQELADVVEGESMINDGTSIVLFTVASGIYFNRESFSFAKFTGEFLWVSFGGVLTGMVLGWLVSKAIHFTRDSSYQIMLSIILAYGSFHIGEGIGVSGVLATVTGGIMLSFEYGRTIKEKHFRNQLDSFWEVIEPTILTFLFLLIGIKAVGYISFYLLGWVILLFIITLLVRYVIIIGVVKMRKTWRRAYGWKEVFILTWSGIKGTMSVALLLGIEGEGVDSIQSISFGVIMLSLILQSLAIYPLSKKLLSKKN